MGKFEEGQSKPSGSGRKKGTPNRKTQHLEEMLDSLGPSVPERLMALLPKLSPEKQADVLIDLMDYLYPKRKAIEAQVRTTVNFENMTNDELKVEHAKIVKRLHGIDINDPQQRQFAIERNRRILNMIESNKSTDHTKIQIS